MLVTHSQGVGREHADSNLIYPARVRQQLFGRADFESWACGGLRTAEIESLLVQAVGRGARLVVLSISPTNLDPPERLSLRYPGTDAPLLAFEPGNLPLVRHTLAWSHTATSDLLTLGAKSWSALLRSRTAMEDTLTSELPEAFAPIAFGRRVPPVERLDDLAQASSAYWGPPDRTLFAFREEQKEKGRRLRDYSEADLEKRLSTMRDLARAAAGMTQGRGIELLWVFSPFDPSRISQDTQPRLERFFIEATAILDENDFGHVDLHALLPATRFLTAGHLDETGHELLATAMMRAIDPALR